MFCNNKIPLMIFFVLSSLMIFTSCQKKPVEFVLNSIKVNGGTTEVKFEIVNRTKNILYMDDPNASSRRTQIGRAIVIDNISCYETNEEIREIPSLGYGGERNEVVAALGKTQWTLILQNDDGAETNFVSLIVVLYDKLKPLNLRDDELKMFAEDHAYVYASSFKI